MTGEKMDRVSKRRPCPVCGRGDWCLVAPDGSTAICPRVAEGSVRRCGEAGYLHLLKDDRPRRPRARCKLMRRVPITSERRQDFETMAHQYQMGLVDQRLAALAAELGVSADSLRRLGVGWNGVGYTFPMSNAERGIIGLRVRYPSGFKAAEKGSSNGLFLPSGLSREGQVLITEGESDAAAGLDLGFAAVGRPSCSIGSLMLSEFARGRDVVIVGDNDGPGRKGAEALASVLVLHCRSVRVVYPPDGGQDLRKWRAAGLTVGQFRRAIETAAIWKPSISAARAGSKRRRMQHGR